MYVRYPETKTVSQCVCRLSKYKTINACRVPEYKTIIVCVGCPNIKESVGCVGYPNIKEYISVCVCVGGVYTKFAVSPYTHLFQFGDSSRLGCYALSTGKQ